MSGSHQLVCIRVTDGGLITRTPLGCSLGHALGTHQVWVESGSLYVEYVAQIFDGYRRLRTTSQGNQHLCKAGAIKHKFSALPAIIRDVIG